MAAHFFSDSASLREYFNAHNETVWHGDVGFGTLSYIDNRNVHVIFDTRKDYEDWDSSGRPVQLSLF